MRFFHIPKKNLLNRPVRTFLTCMGVALGVASFIALIGLSKGVEKAWETGLNEKGTHILGMKKGAAEILTATLDQTLAQAIRQVPGVQMVSGELVDLVQIDGGPTVLLNGWPSGSYLWQTLTLTSGRMDEDDVKKTVILGQGISAAMNLKASDTLFIHGKAFTVKAIHRSKGALNNNSLIMPLSDLQAVTGKKGQVTVFNIRIDNPDNPKNVSDILGKLKMGFPDLVFQETRQIADDNQMLQLFRAIAWGTSSVALIICVFVVSNTLLMSVTERKKEIGIYSALGWPPFKIMGMIGIEAIMMTSAGGIIGIVLGVGGLYWLVEATALRAYIDPQMDIWVAAQTFGAAIVLGILPSIYPAWLATRISPGEALRYE